MSPLLRSVSLVAVAGLATSSFAQAPAWEVMMRSNAGFADLPPGTSLGEIWRTDSGPWDNPKVDNAGHVLIMGLLDTLANPGGTVTTANRRGMWYGVPGNIHFLARDGQSGVAPNTFTSLNLPNPNSWWHNTTSNGAGLVSNPTIAPNGTIFVSSNLNGTGATTTTNTAFWTGTYDLATSTRNLAVVAQRGHVPAGGIAPGTAGALWNTNMNLGTSQFGVNNAGQVAFQSILTGGDVSGTTNNDGIWIGSPGNIQMVFRKGQSAPANVGDPTLLMDAAPTFGIVVNGQGGVVWVSRYRVGTGATTTDATNNAAMFARIGGTVHEVLRASRPVQGLDPAYQLVASTSFATNISLFTAGFQNDNTIYANVKLTGGDAVAGQNDTAVIKRNPSTGNWSIVARQGDATGIPDVAFGTFNSGNSRTNSRGTLLLAAALQGTGTTTLDNQAIFIALNGGAPQLIYRAGTPLNLPGLPADAQITTNSSLISQAGFGLNALNQVVFENSITSAEFTSPLRAIFAWTPKDGLMVIARADAQQFADDLGGAPFLLTIDPRTNGEGGCAGFSDTGWIVMRPQDSFQHQAIYRAQLARCVGDYDCNAAVDGDDVIAFFADWDTGNPAADVDGANGVDGDDVIHFFGGWDNGC